MVGKSIWNQLMKKKIKRRSNRRLIFKRAQTQTVMSREDMLLQMFDNKLRRIFPCKFCQISYLDTIIEELDRLIEENSGQSLSQDKAPNFKFGDRGR